MITSSISNPIDLLKYVLSCQSWGDNETGTASLTAKIKTGVGEGSFDSADLDLIRNYICRFQIADIDKSNTDDLIKKICNQFSLIQYTDKDGYECVKYLFAGNGNAPLFIINDTTEIDSFEPPDATRICINPVIKYGYDYASKTYLNQLTIENVQMAAYNSAYTSGFDGADGATNWALCKEKLWPYAKHIEDMDDTLSENEFIVDYVGAMWRLQNVIKLMSACKFGFTVPFEVGKSIIAGDFINVLFTHLSVTGTSMFSAIVNSASLSKNSNGCTLSITFLDTSPFNQVQMDDSSATQVQMDDSSEIQVQTIS